MSKYDWLLVFHLFGAFLLLSGAVSIQIFSAIAIGRERPGEVAFFFNLGRVAEAAVNVGAIAVLVFGLWLAHNVGYGYGQGWIVASIVLWVVASALGGFGGKRYAEARKEAQRVARTGDAPTPELEGMKKDPLAFVLSSASGVAMVTILVLMIWKPGAHL
jgi:uncharacterized membrane protein